MKYSALNKALVDKYGIIKQLDKLIEEAIELKYELNNFTTEEKLLSEISDYLYTTSQADYIVELILKEYKIPYCKLTKFRRLKRKKAENKYLKGI
jgi:phosphoribosyl-ATP pyrophosphohydrolase